MQAVPSVPSNLPRHQHGARWGSAIGALFALGLLAASAPAQVSQNDGAVCGALVPDPNGGCTVSPSAIQGLGSFGPGGAVVVTGTMGTFIPPGGLTYTGRDEDWFQFSCSSDVSVTINVGRIDGGAVVLSLGSVCQTTCPALPFFQQEIASFTPLEFFLTAGDYYLAATTPVEPNPALPIHACVGYDLAISGDNPAPTCGVQVCPPVGTSYRAYRLTGNPNGVAWSWRIAGPSLASDICELNVPGALPGAFGFNDVRAVSKTFEASINGHAATLGCGATQLIGSAANVLLFTGLASPLGCPPSPPNSTLLTIRVGDTNAACPTWKLYVGPAGSVATCEVSSCTNPCAFNPEIVEIPLSGEDCNENGVDDVLDVLQGTSTDADGDLVLDECESADPCAGGTGSCGAAHGTPGCSDAMCCLAVCGLDPFCCDVAWDNACVRLGAIVCPSPIGDFNGDFTVNGADLAILLGGWGTPDGDLDSDADTDGTDLAILLGSWSN